ncbi:hypothetical protein OPV22_032912 [Ensete ventricosum]|uniref:Uncharacterized protein n=1 Tax=Ensete ventricosum TaxID=4639 RepID=A0AAV8P0H4_ENSVE|nr:hypothetical protein OPV22_032912 [Ensete ventricosum]
MPSSLPFSVFNIASIAGDGFMETDQVDPSTRWVRSADGLDQIPSSIGMESQRLIWTIAVLYLYSAWPQTTRTLRWNRTNTEQNAWPLLSLASSHYGSEMPLPISMTFLIHIL